MIDNASNTLSSSVPNPALAHALCRLQDQTTCTVLLTVGSVGSSCKLEIKIKQNVKIRSYAPVMNYG